MIRGHGIETADSEGGRWGPHEVLLESVMELAIADFMAPPRRILLCGVDLVKVCNGNHRRKYQRCPKKGRPGCGPIEKMIRKSIARQAEAWIMSDENGIFSFVGICEMFGIDSGAARKELLRRMSAGERVSMESIRFAVERPRRKVMRMARRRGDGEGIHAHPG